MSKVPHKAAHPLNPQQADFLKRYLKTGKLKESAVLAGYSPASAGKTAADMIKNNITMRQEIEKHRTAVPEDPADYDLAKAMKDARRAYEIAEEKGQAAAMVAAATHMAKLNKILDDKPVGAQFQIMISGIDGAEPKTVVTVQQPAAITGGNDESGDPV